MNQPTVMAVMLTADRHELAPQAVACFLRQTYPNKALLIYDTGEKPLSVEVGDSICHALAVERGLPIGALRNNANRLVSADVIVHWDDDDWSHPNRIAEQVALLQTSGAACVGYNEMLFWRGPHGRATWHEGAQRLVAHDYGEAWLYTTACVGYNEMLFWRGPHGRATWHEGAQRLVAHDYGEAWLYTNPRSDYALGTSLCYWRKTWEEKPFRDDLPNENGTGEDYQWIQGMKVCGESGLPLITRPLNLSGSGREPRMIARIHGGNSSSQYQNIDLSSSWKRVPEWDARVREILG